MPERPPIVSAVVLNFNGHAFVEEAVGSLLSQEMDDVEVLVVDNASTDGSAEALDAAFGPRIRMLRLPRNVGFGAGNNAGIRVAKGRYVVLLNNDAVACPGFLRELVCPAEESERVGMVAARVMDYSRRSVIDTAGHLLYPDGLNRGRGRLEEDVGQFDECRAALFPSGAAGLYARRMLDEIGLFDESFFLYGDDAELGLRGRLAGWECAFAPKAVAWHRYSQSVGAYSSLKAFHVERNRVLVLFGLFPTRLILASPAYTLARFVLQAWGAVTGRGAAGRLAGEQGLPRLAWLVLRAYASAARALPGVLARRWRRRGLRRLTTDDFRRLLAAHRLSVREVALKE